MQTHHLIRRLLPLCLIAALVVALGAACGDDSTSNKTATPGSSASATASAGAGNGTSTPGGSPTAAPGSSATPAGAVSAVDQIASEQVLIDYYTALNNQDYTKAYGLWADNGAASQQTATQFAQGYANTVRVEAVFDNATPASNGVSIGATIYSVVNTPATPTPGQAVEQYSGVYHLTKQSGAWKISGGDIQKGPNLAAAPADVADATTALESYYKALNAQQYAKAFTYWSNEGEANGNTFTEFANGYANTKSVDPHFGTPMSGGAAGSIYAEVPAVVISTLADGSTQTFCGKYTMRQVNVPPFQLLGWHIDSASVAQVTGPAPDAAAIQQMLTGGCATS
ncbi:MAG: hypothetical protein ACRDG3_11625 [Tepidiformaceae bacterium]